MSTADSTSHPTGISGWLSGAEAWLDDKGKGAWGKGAWIAAMVLAFILFWPRGRSPFSPT